MQGSGDGPARSGSEDDEREDEEGSGNEGSGLFSYSILIPFSPPDIVAFYQQHALFLYGRGKLVRKC